MTTTTRCGRDGIAWPAAPSRNVRLPSMVIAWDRGLSGAHDRQHDGVVRDAVEPQPALEDAFAFSAGSQRGPHAGDVLGRRHDLQPDQTRMAERPVGELAHGHRRDTAAGRAGPNPVAQVRPPILGIDLVQATPAQIGSARPDDRELVRGSDLGRSDLSLNPAAELVALDLRVTPGHERTHFPN